MFSADLITAGGVQVYTEIETHCWKQICPRISLPFMRELRLCSQKPVEILVGAKSQQTVRLWQFQEWHKLHVQSTCGEPSGDIHRCGLTSRLASNDILNVCSYPVELHLLNLWCLIYIYIYSIWYYLHLFPAVCTLYVLEIYIYIYWDVYSILYMDFSV